MMEDFEKEMEKFLESGMFDIKPSNDKTTQVVTQDKLLENFQSYLNKTKGMQPKSPSQAQERKKPIQPEQQSSPSAKSLTQAASKDKVNANGCSPKAKQPEPLTISPKNGPKPQSPSLKPQVKAEQSTSPIPCLKKREEPLPVIEEESDQVAVKPIENGDDIAIKQSAVDFLKLVEAEEAKGTYERANEEPKEVKFKYVKKPKYIDKYKVSAPTNEPPKYKYYADNFKQEEPPYSESNTADIEPTQFTQGSSSKSRAKAKPNSCLLPKDNALLTQTSKPEGKKAEMAQVISPLIKDEGDSSKKLAPPMNTQDDLSVEAKFTQMISDLNLTECKSEVKADKIPLKPLNHKPIQAKPKQHPTQQEAKLKEHLLLEEELDFEDDDINITLTKRPLSSTIKIDNKSLIAPKAQSKTNQYHPYSTLTPNDSRLYLNDIDFKDEGLSFNEKQLNTIQLSKESECSNSKGFDSSFPKNEAYEEASLPLNANQIMKMVQERNSLKAKETSSAVDTLPQAKRNRPSGGNSLLPLKKHKEELTSQQSRLPHEVSDEEKIAQSPSSHGLTDALPQKNARNKIQDHNRSGSTQALSATHKQTEAFYSKSNRSIEEDIDCFSSEPRHTSKHNPIPTPKRPVVTQEEADLQLELQSKIAELTQNAKLVKEENEKLTTMKAEYNRLTTQLRADIEEFHRQKEKDKKEFAQYKEEECNRIEKEKKLQQRNLKQMQALIPSKKEREEMNSIKEQYAQLVEDTKQRDSRNKKVMDRLKRQLEEAFERINDLEKELKVKDEELFSLKLLLKPSSSNRPPSSKSNHKRVQSKERLNNQYDSYNNTPKVTEDSAQKQQKLKRNNSSTNQTPLLINQYEPDHSNKPKSNQSLYQQPQAQSQAQHQMQFENLQDNHPDEDYEMVFLDEYHYPPMNQTPLIKQEITHDGKIVKVYEGNRKEIIFPSGLRKEVFPDGYEVTYLTNKDIRQLYPNKKEVYKSFSSNAIQVRFPDGLQVNKFANGQLEKNFADGTKIINYPDGTIRNVYPDNFEEIFFPDGSLEKIDSNGVVTVDHVDGTKETILPDGTKVTEFPDGRVIKTEKDGSNRNYYK